MKNECAHALLVKMSTSTKESISQQRGQLAVLAHVFIDCRDTDGDGNNDTCDVDCMRARLQMDFRVARGFA